MPSHKPVLLNEFLDFFSGQNLKIFIDGTLGGGGHALALLEKHPEIEKFYGLDRDPSALKLARSKLSPFKDKIFLIQGNYRDIHHLIHEKPVDGIFFDFGLSSLQLDDPERGFSFSHEGPLDMRMDQTQELDAKYVVNKLGEKELGAIFREYGEEPRWRKAAQAIVIARKKKSLETTRDLTEALKHVLTWRRMRGKKIHPMTLVFQALRIYVNDELRGIEEGVLNALALLAVGGRFGVISFHSLEDRIVKNTFNRFKKEMQILTKKPIVPTREEVKDNPRSRSAKMRFIQKI